MDYEEDILFAVDWQNVEVGPLVAKIPDNITSAEHQMRRIRLADSGEERIIEEVAEASQELLVFDMAYAVRMVSDIVPNAWWSREIIGQLIGGLTARGFDATNDDTEYKKAVLRLMSDAFAVEHVERVGELELIIEDGTAVECDLVLMPEWRIKLPTML